MFFKALKVNAKLYHIHDPELIPCGILLKLFGKKIIYDVHENFADDIYDKPWIKYKKTLFFFFDLFEKIAAKLFYFILAEWSYQKRYSDLKARYQVILNYCDISFFKPFHTANRDPFHLFYIGIVLENRSIIEIIKAVHLLHKQKLPVHFHCVGELYSDLSKKIQTLPEYEQVKDFIHFHGRLSLDKGYELSTQMGIGLCLIHPMKNSMESFPTKMFEYMAIGLPQVVSNFPLYISVVEKHNCGLSANPLSPSDIASKVSTLIQQTDLRKKMELNALENAPQYHWDSEKEKLLKLYASILNIK